MRICRSHSNHLAEQCDDKDAKKFAASSLRSPLSLLSLAAFPCWCGGGFGDTVLRLALLRQLTVSEASFCVPSALSFLPHRWIQIYNGQITGADFH